jgi:hypothetical protein
MSANDYTFKRFDNRRRGTGLYLRIRPGHIQVSPQAVADLGSPSRVSVEYDAERRAVRLVPDSGGNRLFVKPAEGRSAYLSCAIGKQGLLPLGTYVPSGKGIFVYEEQPTTNA